MAATSGALRTLAAALMKMANDVRLYASGPRAGIGELRIPENEPGSSIMPGKINPTQCEAMTMVAVQVFGNDLAVALANIAGPVPAERLQAGDPAQRAGVDRAAGRCLPIVRSLHCARGLEPNLDRIREHVEESLMLVTALNPHIGYEKSAAIALQGASRAGHAARCGDRVGPRHRRTVRRVGPSRKDGAAARRSRNLEPGASAATPTRLSVAVSSRSLPPSISSILPMTPVYFGGDEAHFGVVGARDRARPAATFAATACRCS